MKEKTHLAPAVAKLLFSIFLLALTLAVAIPSFAWFSRKVITAYAPVSSNESLYIGAGHISILRRQEDDSLYFDPDVPFEDVRYLYLNAIDATDGNDYQDFVFCVYGESISQFRLQFGHTTNNQFSYEIYAVFERTLSDVSYPVMDLCLHDTLSAHESLSPDA